MPEPSALPSAILGARPGVDTGRARRLHTVRPAAPAAPSCAAPRWSAHRPTRSAPAQTDHPFVDRVGGNSTLTSMRAWSAAGVVAAAGLACMGAAPGAAFVAHHSCGISRLRAPAACSAAGPWPAARAHGVRQALPARVREPPRGAALRVAAADGAEGEDTEEIDIGAAIDSELSRLRALLAAGGAEGERLGKALALTESSAAAAPRAGKLERAIKKKSGAFASLIEFCVEEGSKQDVEDVSRACRMGKAAAIVLDVGVALAGRDRETTLQVIAEQARAKGNFPGPCPLVIRHCALVDPLQVAEVHALGASALMLPSAALSADGAALLSAAAALGLEVVVEVDDEGALAAAREAGARIMCVRGVGSLEEALALRKKIPAECAALVAVPAQQDNEDELSDVGEAKGAGFDGVVLMEAVIEAENDLEYCICILPAIQSKKSSTFAFAAIGTQGEPETDQKMMPAGMSREDQEGVVSSVAATTSDGAGHARTCLSAAARHPRPRCHS